MIPEKKTRATLIKVNGSTPKAIRQGLQMFLTAHHSYRPAVIELASGVPFPPMKGQRYPVHCGRHHGGMVNLTVRTNEELKTGHLRIVAGKEWTDDNS